MLMRNLLLEWIKPKEKLKLRIKCLIIYLLQPKPRLNTKVILFRFAHTIPDNMLYGIIKMKTYWITI